MFVEIIFWFLLVIFLLYIFNRLTLGISTSSACLVGKTAIVTGGNAGIGYQIVKILASRGCKVIIADKDNSDESRNNIIKETSNPNIVSKHLDLSSFDSVRKFAEDFNKTEKQLDILMHNAGIGKSYTEKTVDGFNDVVHINHLGPFLLTHLLIGKLQESAPSRIIFTSSSLAFVNNLSKDNFLDYKNFDYPIVPYNLIRTYSNTKIESLIISNEFARRLQGTGVTCNAIHPGIARTDIIGKSLNTKWFTRVVVKIFNLIAAKSPWEAAQTSIHVATCKSLNNVSGKYYWDCKEMVMPSLTKNKQFCQWLYQESEKLVKLEDDEKLNVNF